MTKTDSHNSFKESLCASFPTIHARTFDKCHLLFQKKIAPIFGDAGQELVKNANFTMERIQKPADQYRREICVDDKNKPHERQVLVPEDEDSREA